MEPFGFQATFWATLVAVLISWRGQRKKSLTLSGSAAAFGVGFLIVWTGLRGFNLLVFYQIGTMATKYKKNLKIKLDGTVATTGSIARGPSQVLACSLLAVFLSLIHAIYCGSEHPIHFGASGNTNDLASSLTCGIMAHHATCLADTLASELGILSQNRPVLITQPWKKVPSGTNGGVTLLGFIWSALGGLIIGMSTIFFDRLSGLAPLNVLPTILFATTCGLVGSLIDSLLGATLQESYWDPDKKLVYQHEDNKPSSAQLITGMNLLNNEQVNLASVAITTILGGSVLGPFFFPR